MGVLAWVIRCMFRLLKLHGAAVSIFQRCQHSKDPNDDKKILARKAFWNIYFGRKLDAENFEKLNLEASLCRQLRGWKFANPSFLGFIIALRPHGTKRAQKSFTFLRVILKGIPGGPSAPREISSKRPHRRIKVYNKSIIQNYVTVLNFILHIWPTVLLL